MERKRAIYCEVHRSWCHIATCSRCSTEDHASSMWFVVPPVGRPGGTLRVCDPCWSK